MEGGRAIQREDLSKNFQDLNKTENEKREMNILACDIEDNIIKEDKNKDNDSNLTNNNTVTSGPLINTFNSDNNILENIDKDYNQNHIRNISILSNKYFFIQTFLVLKIQFVLILCLVWAGCYFNINKAFIKSTSAMLGTFIPTIIILILLSFMVFILKFLDMKEEKLPYVISCIIYIFGITFLCYLLTKYTKYKYILMVLFLIIIDCFLLEIYHSFKKTNKYLFLTFLPLIIVNTILIIVFSLKWIEKAKVIFNISIIIFVIILYLILPEYFMIYCEREEFMLAVNTFNYSLFLFIGSIVYFIIALLILLIALCCKKINKKKINNDKNTDKVINKDKNKDEDKNKDIKGENKDIKDENKGNDIKIKNTN